jgi:hypothetical protein
MSETLPDQDHDNRPDDVPSQPSAPPDGVPDVPDQPDDPVDAPVTDGPVDPA